MMVAVMETEVSLVAEKLVAAIRWQQMTVATFGAGHETINQ